jgi:hypothetical protein
MTDARTPRDLQVERSRRGRVLLWIAALAVVIAFGAWFVTHPAPLPVPDEPVKVQVPIGEAVYVGVYDPAADANRTLHISRATTEVDGPATVVARVCRDGTVSVTSQPEEFCSSMTDAEGATVAPGDGLVLEILDANEAGEATIAPMEISFRDGIRWGTQPVGPTVEATFLSR